tara:strand:+ start:171 stop:566 length:396 start_codon:yes stop_codon:yes gene_type:complete
MKIRITSKNSRKIQAALAQVNGRARGHTFTTFEEIAELATQAEMRRTRLRLSRDHAKGIRLLCTSGDEVARSYKWARRATCVELTLCTTGWCLTDIASDDVYAEGGGFHTILTPAAEAIALDAFRTTFSVE